MMCPRAACRSYMAVSWSHTSPMEQYIGYLLEEKKGPNKLLVSSTSCNKCKYIANYCNYCNYCHLLHLLQLLLIIANYSCISYLIYRIDWGLRSTSRQISFEFLFRERL
jgi:hypothetical protein